jgi:uncharacterized membrane protein YtjA (UPF0391 family)
MNPLSWAVSLFLISLLASALGLPTLSAAAGSAALFFFGLFVVALLLLGVLALLGYLAVDPS